jgi:hypothetical protein
VGATLVDFSPLTCEPGTWSGSPSFTYTFQVENASAQALQSAPTNVLAPLPGSGISAGLYRATATRLPYNERITFTGVHQRSWSSPGQATGPLHHPAPAGQEEEEEEEQEALGGPIAFRG